MAKKGRRPAARKKARSKTARRPVKKTAKSAAKAPKPKAKSRVAPPPKAEKPRTAPAVRPAREEVEEETVCSLEFLSDGRSFVARLDTTKGGMREHKAPSFTDLLELVAEDLREEFLEA